MSDLLRAAQQPGADIRAALETWRDSLVNLTGSNRLINFRRSKTGMVEITGPSAAAIVDGLRQGREWKFRGAEDGDTPAPRRAGSDDVLHSPMIDKDLGATLRRLLKRSKQEYLDRGVSVLYIATGMLHWKDDDGTPYASPMLLLPVELTALSPRDVPRLQVRDDDPLVNPALSLRLRQMGITLPTVDALADVDVTHLDERFQDAIAERDGWRVGESVVLSCFTFHKEAMYRDLLDNEQQVLNHPIVRALATKDHRAQTDAFAFDPITCDRVDAEAPPEDTPLVLDADSSQRACIAAAAAGRSFVMDGPPGTGKSQTIANMIGALLHAGKTVLFVSEKAAALEVVQSRLSEIGLDNYLLELHSHKASRKEVATALSDALANVPVPPKGMDTVSRRTLVERRQQLNGYADAMNRVRQPLGMSLHDVLGMAANLSHVPAAPAPERLPGELTPQSLNAVRDAADRLHRAWRPAAQGLSFLWRDVVDRNPLDSRLYQAQMALEALAGVVDYNRAVTRAFELHRPSSATVLSALISHAGQRPPLVLDEWLLDATLDNVETTVEELGRDLAAVRDSAHAVSERAGVRWQTMPKAGDLPHVPSLLGLTPAAVDLRPLTQTAAVQLAEAFSRDADSLANHHRALSNVATSLGLPPIETFQDADRVAAVALLGFGHRRPERSWFSPDALTTARSSATVLRRALEGLEAAESEARRYYTDAALAHPLPDLVHRFATAHRGLGKLRRQYRQDKTAVAGFTASGVAPASAAQWLELAAAWKEAADAFAAAESDHAAILGRYWDQRSTDFSALDDALRHADEVMRITPPAALPHVVEHVCATTHDHALHSIVTEAQAEFGRWRSALRSPPEPTARPELAFGPIVDAIAWLRGHLPALNSVSAVTAAVGAVVGRPVDFVEAESLLQLREAAELAEAALVQNEARYTATLGAAYQGIDTDEKALSTAVQWTQSARQLHSGADAGMTRTQVESLASCRSGDVLPAKIREWDAARQRVIAAFADARHAELGNEVDDYHTAQEILQELRDDSSGQEEWFSYLDARRTLAEHHLDGAIDFCIDQSVPADQIRAVIERALLRSWADEVIRGDSNLQPIRAEDRSALVQEYRLLDSQLITGAVGDIIRSVNARRPSASAVGEPALIRREGMKKTRHLAVRQLIAQTRNASLALKPCFMMSPLAVSQFLPPDMQFDVVIFDEASQVTPADAVNCIYRGKALITAGDDRQLPPTSFFDRVTEADEDEDAATDVTDFQSILELSKACGAFQNLGLTWHYRSRHEALIAFSNHAFYQGRLVTYPGADAEGPDIGVELIHVPGVYRRGTSRDNPVEAQRVADRVLHHFETRPDLSLGVVTFSVAQAEAIEAAIERMVSDRPDLNRFLGDDRLHGFFVKSLESVQGDERDIMIFSIGYGFDDLGKISGNFGALNKPKGWRRLNVAITRARQRIEVVSSIRGGDVPDVNNESVRHLAAYLDFAERGLPALALELGPDNRDTDSPFEDSVLDTVRSWGYSVQPQVGAAGYRIDLGVRHPAHPNVFAIGIECDGAMYHSSQAARDRDRLREQVLRGLGWNLHRIWGTAWYRNRKEEEKRLREAIDRAVAAPVSGRLSSPSPTVDRPAITTMGVELNDVPRWAEPYRKGTLSSLPHWANPSDFDSRFKMVSSIESLAAAEGPVHIDVALQRMRDAWYIGRVGPQIRSTIEAAIELANVTWDGTFIGRNDARATTVRYPADGVTRKVEQVADAEILLALVNLVRDGGTVDREELLTATARLFGWARRGADINARLTAMLVHALSYGQLLGNAEGGISLAVK